nr:hypothetical protein Iba_chr04aCG6510 [Ipomoea batatas]
MDSSSIASFSYDSQAGDTRENHGKSSSFEPLRHSVHEFIRESPSFEPPWHLICCYFNLLCRWMIGVERPTSIIASQIAGGEDQLPEGDCRKSCCPPEFATCCQSFARLVRFAVSEKVVAG